MQWREASYSDSRGDVLRVYTVCNVAVVAVDNWLVTPFIGSSPGNRVYVDVKFSMRKCTKYPNPGRLQQCKVSDRDTGSHIICFYRYFTSFVFYFCYFLF